MSDRAPNLRVFLSYARDDGSPFADELMAGLEAAGFDPFLDRHDIAAGEEWERRLDGLLRQADTIVYIITPGAVASAHCEWEVDHAARLSKRLIPVVAIEPPEGATPAKLSRLNYVFFTRGRPFGVALKELCDALRADLPWIREHTRLAELAERWHEKGRPGDRLLRGSDVAAAMKWLSTWKAPSPEPTQLHRDFIAESEAAELSRMNQERQQLEERERLIQRDARRTRIFLGVTGVLLVSTIAGFYGAAREKASAERAQLMAHEETLKAETARQEADAAKAELAERVKDLEELKRNAAERTIAITSAGEPGPQTPGVTGSDAAAVRDLMRQARIDSGWDIDIFYCEGRAGAANKAKAQTVNTLLLAERTRQLQSDRDPSEVLPLGQVRLRPLPELINSRPGYNIRADVVRAERGSGASDERPEMARLINMIGQGKGPALAEDASSTPTPYYLSVFLCGG